jgi:RNA polymerase sigma-70 factor (ECF subfamily)
MQPRRRPDASTARSRDLELTPVPATDQLTEAPSADTARFKRDILPQLDAAYNFARFLSRNADAAEDIVQEAFLRAYRSFAGYRGGDARAWIFAIVRNCYRSWLMDRRRKARLEVDYHGDGDSVELISTIASDENTPEEILVRQAEGQTLRLILNAMPRPFREILILREIEELSYHQISAVTALPIGTVMSRLARARKAFGDAWRREVENGG